MIEIWTEDSTAGYYFLTKINRAYYGKALKIVKHNGIGESFPAGDAKYGGILYHLKLYGKNKLNNLVLLYIDKAIDIQGTAENYANVVKEAKKYKNVHIIEQICFEASMLSYKDLFSFSGNRDNNLKNIVIEFTKYSSNLSCFRPCNFSKELQDYIKGKTKKQYEHIAKILLTDVTKVVTMYGGEQHNLSLISGGKVGDCWKKDCCVIPCQYIAQSKKCGLSINNLLSIDNKINNVISQSNIRNSVNQINGYIKIYIQQHYTANDKREEAYKQRCNDEMVFRKAPIQIEKYGFWNYKNVYLYK